MSRLATVLILAAVGVEGVRQGIPTKTLNQPEAEYAEPFTFVEGVRELSDGRVVVSDPRDKVVQIIDLKKGTSIKVGREGAGPGEYGLPQRVLALGGDSSAVVDFVNRRMLLVSKDGKAGGLIEFPSSVRGGGPMGGLTPRFADARGRFYSATPGIMMTPEGPKTSDSSAIIRWERSGKTVDTIAFLALPKGNAQVSGGGGNMRVQIGGGMPFAPRDEWSVAPDGRVVVARASGYRVEWYAPNGAKTVGPEVKYDRLKVSAGHKAEFLEARRNALGIMVTEENGRRSARAVPGGPNLPEPKEWPEYLPPFTGDAVFATATGQVWVRRTAEAGAPPTYDIFDASGKVVQRVILPKKSRLVAFGNGSVYVVRTDEDDLQYLRRYKL